VNHVRAIAFAALALLILGVPPVSPADAGACAFVLGFKAIHDQIPATVGDCVDDEGHNPQNGDALQHTARGLLVWRKADNFTAFTDGYRAWVDGPYGLQARLNTQRFSWEANPGALPIVVGSGSVAAPLPTSSPPPIQLAPGGPVFASQAPLAGDRTAPGQLNGPSGIAVDPQNFIWVADALNHRIQKFSAGGQPLAQVGTFGTTPGQFRFPFAVATDRQGNLYVADTGNNRIQKLSQAGQPLAQWGAFGTQPGQFGCGRGITLASQGNSYAADTCNNRLHVSAT